VGSSTDIDDGKRSEAALRQADRQKDEFLAVLAHELRNPLAPIRTGLQLVKIAGDDAARRERACTVMDRQLMQLVRLVDDLLDMSRITNGKIELHRQRVELASVIHAAMETSRPGIESSGHELTVTFPAEPIVIDGDATRLAQVFANLLNNAAKYTPRGGHISLTGERRGGVALVRVTDNGIGIPADMLSRVFEMFTQVDRSLEKTHGGLGIGLTLVRRLVGLHGGSVEARSGGPGAGSEFIVSLPVAAAAVADGDAWASAPAPPPAPLSLRRILVVDDNQDAAESLAEMLRLRGHHVRTAHDGVAAVEAAAAFLPDIVLLDLGMPRLNGYEAAPRIRERLGRGARLVALTGWGQPDDRRRAREAGFDHHLVKPVDAAELEAVVGELTSDRV
jgi:CheY-like chemotaxis protein